MCQGLLKVQKFLKGQLSVQFSSVAQSCPTLCDPMDCNPPGSSSMGFSRQEYWSGLPCPPPGDLPEPGIKPRSPMFPALAGGFFTTSTTWEAQSQVRWWFCFLFQYLLFIWLYQVIAVAAGIFHFGTWTLLPCGNLREPEIKVPPSLTGVLQNRAGPSDRSKPM